MNKQALLNGVGDVGTSECKVLKGLGKAAVKGGVVEACTGCGRKLGGCVDMGGYRFAIEHADAIKNFERILFLRDVETGSCLGDINPEKMMERPHIRHGELAVEGAYDGLEEGGGASYEYN